MKKDLRKFLQSSSMDDVRKSLQKLTMRDALKKAIALGVYKGCCSDCIDGTSIVIGDETFVWDGKIPIQDGCYVWFNDYLEIEERKFLIEGNFNHDKDNSSNRV